MSEVEKLDEMQRGSLKVASSLINYLVENSHVPFTTVFLNNLLENEPNDLLMIVTIFWIRISNMT